jgi:hypothetical protein
LLSRWRAYAFNSEGAFLVPPAPEQVSFQAQRDLQVSLQKVEEAKSRQSSGR